MKIAVVPLQIQTVCIRRRLAVGEHLVGEVDSPDDQDVRKLCMPNSNTPLATHAMAIKSRTRIEGNLFIQQPGNEGPLLYGGPDRLRDYRYFIFS